LPETQSWVQADPFMFYDFPGYTLKVVEEHMMRVRVSSEKDGQAP